MENNRRSIPIYASNGEPGALLVYPYLYNLSGEWIGWVTPEKEVYSLLGIYIGYLTGDPRILRRRTIEEFVPRRTPPASPHRLYPPATIPLAPMMPELPYDLIDVLLECPEQLHTSDSGELRDDMD